MTQNSNQQLFLKMPGLLLYIRDIDSRITCHNIANAIEIAGFGEIYGVKIRKNTYQYNDAIVELVHWDCDENEWLLEVFECLRDDMYITIPYFINDINGKWYACKYCEEEYELNNSLFVSSYEERTADDFENQLMDRSFYQYDRENYDDSLNYSRSFMETQSPLFHNLEIDDIETSSVISSLTILYDDTPNNIDLSCDLDLSTVVPKQDCLNEFANEEKSYNHYLSLYNNPEHPMRRSRIYA